VDHLAVALDPQVAWVGERRVGPIGEEDAEAQAIAIEYLADLGVRYAQKRNQ
jgi:hypothetical protein